jgi:hypothetical protein
MPKAALAAIASFLLLFFASSLASAESLEREMREVERLRQLRFNGPVSSEVISREELPERLRVQMEKSLTYSFAEYEEMLRALYLVDPSSSGLMNPLLSLLQSQVLAYYDPDTDRFFFVDSPPEGLAAQMPADLMRDIVVIHELVHALQDQRLDIARRDRELRDDWDGAMALHAVLEGEASLVMLSAAVEKAGITLDDMLANDTLLDTALAGIAAAPVEGGDAPRYFVESLKFPYVEGLRFVIAAYRRGGWKAVDQLLVDPPASTREILHPALYFEGMYQPEPFEVNASRPSSFPDARLGQAHWSFLTGTEIDGWLDDRVRIQLDRGCRTTVLVTTEWESEDAARRFAAPYERFLATRGAGASVVRVGTVVRAAYGFNAAAIREFLGNGSEIQQVAVPRRSSSAGR